MSHNGANSTKKPLTAVNMHVSNPEKGNSNAQAEQKSTHVSKMCKSADNFLTNMRKNGSMTNTSMAYATIAKLCNAERNRDANKTATNMIEFVDNAHSNLIATCKHNKRQHTYWYIHSNMNNPA